MKKISTIMFVFIIFMTTNLFSETMVVTATAYSSQKGQTDSTPFLAAWNNKLSKHDKFNPNRLNPEGVNGSIAVSQDLLKNKKLWDGDKVVLFDKHKNYIGIFIVKDTMNKRFKNKIDIYFHTDTKSALKWGVKSGIKLIKTT